MRVRLGLGLALLLLQGSASGAPLGRAQQYDLIFHNVHELVQEFAAAKPGVKAVLLGAVTGEESAFLHQALEEALLEQRITRANTQEEMAELRENYRKQGVDVYKDPAFQRALREATKAKLTLTMDAQCEVVQDPTLPRSCVLWLRAQAPTKTVFTAHRAFEVTPPSRYQAYGLFLGLLAIYAFLPPLLHRLDIALRRPDGSWRSVLLFPFFLLGNRIVVFLLVMSFLWAGPFTFELWVAPLEDGLEPAIQTLGLATAALFGLHLVGCLFVSLWREGGGIGYGATFRELFVFHPRFWSRRIEGAAHPSGLSG